MRFAIAHFDDLWLQNTDHFDPETTPTGISRVPHLQYPPNLYVTRSFVREELLVVRNVGGLQLRQVIRLAKSHAVRQPSCRQPLRGPRVRHRQSGNPCQLELALRDGPW